MFTLDNLTSRQNCYVIHRKNLQGYDGILYLYDCSSISLRGKVQKNRLFTCNINARKVMAIIFSSGHQFGDDKLLSFRPEDTVFSPVRLQSGPADTYVFPDGVLGVWERGHLWDALSFSLARQTEPVIGLDNRKELDTCLVELLPTVGVPDGYVYGASDFIIQMIFR